MNEIRSIDSQILIRVQCLLDLDRLQPPYTDGSKSYTS